MVKDTEEIEEKVEAGAELGGEVEPEDKEVELKEASEPKDLRGALKAAMKEASEKGEAEDVNRKDDNKVEKDTDKSKIQTRDSTNKNADTSKNDKVDVEKSEKETKFQIEPPPYWKNKGKALWDKLTDEDKKFIAAREKEVSDGFAQYSPKVKAFEELESVISPRRQMIRDFGVTEAQTVDRLFQWMENLAHPNASHRVSSFKQLAQSFGVDLNQLAPRQLNSEQPENTPTEVSPSEPPEYFNQFAGTVAQEVNGLKQTIASQQQAAADAFVSNWAYAVNSEGEKLRPYFDKVRILMAQLSSPVLDRNGRVITQPAVPLKNGMIDLDAAYEAAIKIHPEIAAEIKQAEQEKAAKKAKEKADNDAKEKAAKLAKARNAGSGIKPAAASMASISPSSSRSVNGIGGKKPQSVRDSIKAAFQELNE